MNCFKKIVLASNNQGKLSEFQSLLNDEKLPIEVISQGSLGIDEAVEDGLSFVENAIIKARYASASSGLPALADDSGLCVDVLGGLPGIYSARYATLDDGFDNTSILHLSKDAANNAKLLTVLKPYRDGTLIKARFVCVLVLVRHANDPLPIIVQKHWAGEILDAPAGDNGFGYDPVFFVPDVGKSAALLDIATKNALSHRGQAIRALVQCLKDGG